jgi:excisionase family DNA binding protein
MLMTKATAAEQLAISVRFLEKLIVRDQLPVVRIGKSVRLSRAVVEKLARHGAAPDGSPMRATPSRRRGG